MKIERQLASNDLKAGDVMLLRDLGEFTHKMIGFGQGLLSHGRRRHANIVHAGIYDGARRLLEASGEDKGLRSGEFATKDVDYKFLVFRYQDSNVARLARNWADILVEQRIKSNNEFGQYSKPGALGSLLHRSSLGTNGASLSGDLRGWAAKGQGDADAMQQIQDNSALYCSGFVVQCYVMASPANSPAINLDYRYVSPKRLQGELNKGGGWILAGFIQAGKI